jgi:8-oxo-dGTP pyrophosphatase MutT (NUDIX family)
VSAAEQADPPEPAVELPDWLRQLVAAARRVSPAELSRYAPTDGAGRASAVLLLFGAGPAGPDVLLIQRSATLRRHAGQPAFPGGAVDPTDQGPADTALREAAEETGLSRSGVTVVAQLPELYLAVTDFAVTPVIGWWHARSPVGVVDPAEVARVEAVPIAELVEPANRWRVRAPSGHLTPAFGVRGMTVWGFTALLLDQVLELAGWAGPWDRDDIRPLAGLAHAGQPGSEPAPTAPEEDPVAPYEPDPSGEPDTIGW